MSQLHNQAPLADEAAPPDRRITLKLLFLCLITAIIAVLIARHVTGINGPTYWQWPWRISFGWLPYIVLVLASIPTAIAQYRFFPTNNSGSASCVVGIVLMMGTVLCFELADRASDLSPPDLTRIATIIEDPGSNGYFTHAEEFLAGDQSLRQFLDDYPKKMASFTMHARNKPPGSILFYVPFLKLAATENGAALAAGLFIAILATLSVPATYLLVLEFTASKAAAFAAAGCISLSPGLLLFLPEFDQFYPVFSCSLLILWSRALRTSRPAYPIALGLLCAAVCFMTFNLLVLGVFFLAYAALASRTVGITTVLRQAALALGAFIAAYLLLWLSSGYDPIHTLITGYLTHLPDLPALHRIWPYTVPYDLTDFALGAGWVGAFLAIVSLFSAAPRTKKLPICLICLAQPLAVALSGQLQGETARVWIFMLPLLLVPAGLELATWPRAARMIAFGCLVLLATLLSQNMVFV